MQFHSNSADYVFVEVYLVRKQRARKDPLKKCCSIYNNTVPFGTRAKDRTRARSEKQRVALGLKLGLLKCIR